ncbi:uncharacterized protein ACLA_080660 [Aspergillus clavatus NRRL 1]|uniref:DUF7582 domain-containing protein n=1 Tax=Aspergillus clavatus (strain ATCC 1007 / CBS 513.65 / DSM 816 / NCTC 3887 / NRRL 1 / QM 1276 / 107) TaxID=344612 RepID=A1CSU5_ASPCL|nr:uncharacterized protein ACLA_080660 [Aspergillus clavatus NRRL 1]EAW06382.1 conserved hypothetical protein [Aspergillus clavatus NRRL 1]
MGVLRLPRPTGIYVPSSPRSLTSDMISSPLSPGFNFDSETVTPSIIPALDYISAKLQQKMMHVTLLVGRGKPFPTGHASDLMVIPIAHLDLQSWRTLCRIVAKGAKKFSLGQSWTDALTRSQFERQANEYLIQQSILQNEVVFSREGLTLLNVDRIHTFKRRLCILSNRETAVEEPFLASCVHLLHRTICDYQGRPFSKAFFHRVYEQLDVRDDLLTRVATTYKKEYGQEGIVLPPRPKPEYPRKSPIRPVRQRRAPAASPGGKPLVTKRGPKTPLSASDVTPITRNEWNMFVGSGIRQVNPTVTKWTPSPIVLAAA